MGKTRYNKVFRDGIIALAFCGLLSVVFIVSAIVSNVQYHNLVANMKSIEATIVDIDLDISVRGPDAQEIYITYSVDDVVYNRELSTDTQIAFDAGMEAHYSVGDKLAIFYNPQNPNEIAALRSVYVSYGFMTIGWIVFALALVGLVYLLKNRRKFLISEEEYENEKRQRKNSALLSKNGKRIRWQYFNTYIYIQLSFIPAVPMMILLPELKKGHFDLWSSMVEMSEAMPVVIAIYAIFIAPFVVLSILNRFWFGKVLGVVDGSSLFLNDREVDIDSIMEITYHPNVMSRRRFRFCYATFAVQTKNGEVESFDVAHFPLYGLKEIKKHNPDVKLGMDKYVWFLVLCPTVVSAVLGFLLG